MEVAIEQLTDRTVSDVIMWSNALFAG